MNPFKQNTVYKFRRSYHAVGFAFDIDGVLIKGKRLLNQTKPALKLLSERKIPFIFLTNGGGVKEQMKADQLAQLFDLPISQQQVVLSHSPMKSLVKKYRNDLVVVIGGAKNECKKVAKNYGFEKVLTTNDVLRTNHSIWPFSNAFDSEEDDSFDLSKEPFKAIMMFHDSRDWGRDLQICTDILRSKNGILGTVKDNGTPQAVQLYFSNPDFIWSNEYPVNRFAQGAFKTCLECLYKKLTKEHLISTKFGKPEKITYEFATKILNDHANAMWGLPKDTSRRIVYAIGDNPDSDIDGANNHGWESVLVRTGVWNEVDHHRKHDHNSTLVKSDVLEAVEFILRKEKLY